MNERADSFETWLEIHPAILSDYRIAQLPDHLWRRYIELHLESLRALPSDPNVCRLRDIPGSCADNSAEWLELLDSEHQLRDLGLIQPNSRLGYLVPTEWIRYGSRWALLRPEILQRDNWICRYCGAQATHVDHVVPRCQGGGDEWDNLVAACAHCNLKKGGRTPKQAGMELQE